MFRGCRLVTAIPSTSRFTTDPGGGPSGQPAVATTVSLAHAQGIQVGDGNTQINYFVGPQTAIEWPRLVGVIPLVGEHYQYRDHLDVLADGTDRERIWLVNGLSGVGKSQLAADYAARAWQRQQFDLVVWLPASSRESIVSGFAQCGNDLAAAAPGNTAHAAQQFLSWLGTTQRTWLIVIDDLSRPSDIAGLWPPSTATGTTIVTTRRHDSALCSQPHLKLTLDAFTSAQALAFLDGALLGEPGRLAEAVELAGDLGTLPIALAQAAAYMNDRNIGCAQYRRRLAERRLAEVVPEPEALPDQHQNTVATTWSLSLEAANQLAPAGLAAPAMTLVSLMDGSAIPLSVAASPSFCRYLAGPVGSSSTDSGRTVSADDARDAIHCLRRLSLVEIENGTEIGTIRVHRLVQRATRERHAVVEVREAAQAAANAIEEAWGEDTGWVTDQQLRASCEALFEHAPDALWDNDIHPVQLHYGFSLGEAGHYEAARRLFTTLAEQAQDRLGPGHSATLACRGNEAHWQDRAGDHQGAVTANRALLEDMNSLEGNQIQSLSTRNNLIVALANCGQPDQAVSEGELLLQDEMAVLGLDDRLTLTTRANLASFMAQNGNHQGAMEALEALLADRVRLFGPEHPDTLLTLSNLANQRAEAGMLEEAIEEMEQLVSVQERVLGPSHPSTLTTRNNLAAQRGYSGKPAEAAIAFQKLVADLRRVLGDDHPYTQQSRANLAYWRGELGIVKGAISDLTKLHADRERIFGPSHPATLTTRVELAGWKAEQGQYSAAITEFAAVVAKYEELFGADNPETLITKARLADCFGESGDPQEAVRLYGAMLSSFELAFGPDHEHTLTARGKHAMWKFHAGSRAEAIADISRLIRDAENSPTASKNLIQVARQYRADWLGESVPTVG